MREHNPIANDARRKTRQKKLGADAVCVLCGHAQLEALIGIKRSLLESHHVVGKANDANLTVPLCRNCHAKETERLKHVGASMEKPNTLLDSLVAFLRGVGAFLMSLAETCLDLADRLARFIEQQDQQVPGWRDMAGAQ